MATYQSLTPGRTECSSAIDADADDESSDIEVQQTANPGQPFESRPDLHSCMTNITQHDLLQDEHDVHAAPCGHGYSACTCTSATSWEAASAGGIQVNRCTVSLWCRSQSGVLMPSMPGCGLALDTHAIHTRHCRSHNFMVTSYRTSSFRAR